jgi:hypothetical protein
VKVVADSHLDSRRLTGNPSYGSVAHMRSNASFRGLFIPLALALAACSDDVVVGASDTGSDSSGNATSTGATSSGTDTSATDSTNDSSGTDTSTDDSSDSTDGTTGDEPDPGEALFAPGTIAEFDISLSPASLAVLEVDGKIYVKGDLDATVDGQAISLTDIGVRLKGNYGSFRTLDGKSAFLLDFNRYVPGQDFLGIDKLAVNNMVQDPSMQREVLGYKLFRESGVPAPRAAHAVVSVNGEPYGLYTTVEAVDNDEFLNHWYDDNGGNLYEGAYGSDLFLDLLSTYDIDNGNEVDYADLVELITTLDTVVDPEDFVAIADEVIDMDLYLTMAAVDIYLGDWDGYPWSRNNYFMYRRPSDMRWVWMPWGIDQTMADYLPAFDGAGRVTQMCNASLECRAMLASKMEEVVARVDQLGLAAEAATLGGALHDAALADPRKEYDIVAVEGTIASNIDFLTNRGQQLLDQLICTDPSLIDDDNDGYNGCGEDCNDDDPFVYPGADEVCDLDDDNCDGQWDEDPMCPQCIIQPLPAPSLNDAAFCFVQRTWNEAEAECVTQGGHLISVHDQATQDFLTGAAFGIAGSDWWIGLNDQSSEGNYVWSDASPTDFTSWAGGEPNNAGEEDCSHFAVWAGGTWNDQPCDAGLRFICELP